MSRTLYNTYERLLEMIDKLWEAHIYETDPTRRLKIEHDLKRLEADREIIESQLERMEKQEMQIVGKIYKLRREGRNLIREIENLLRNGN